MTIIILCAAQIAMSGRMTNCRVRMTRLGRTADGSRSMVIIRESG
jgi:hypothetical protein